MIIVDSRIIKNGLAVSLDEKDYRIHWPEEVWSEFPDEMKTFLADNIAFGTTHFLPLVLKQPIKYNTRKPLFEPHLFNNQLYDMMSSEETDNAPHLSYLKEFHNQEFEFAKGESRIPEKPFEPQKCAIIPFTFGKESMTTFALCRELGIRPILIYCQEPSQPYEEEYKLKKLEELTKKFNVDFHFIVNETGLFRYGKAFNIPSTEIGWGTQITMLSLFMLPFVYFYKAKYILYGNECSCNESYLKEGWRLFSAGYDQTSAWTQHNNNMIRLSTRDSCSVKSSLEPLEEISIFYLLHKRYTELGKYQFSCSAELPLVEDNQWCHKCYKCARMYLFSLVCGIDPKSIGFKKDIMQMEGIFNHYFGDEKKTGSRKELDFAFYVLSRKNISSPYVEKFRKELLPKLDKFENYLNLLCVNNSTNLPEEYEDKMKSIFEEEVSRLRREIITS